jgi:hypothetical protein
LHQTVADDPASRRYGKPKGRAAPLTVSCAIARPVPISSARLADASDIMVLYMLDLPQRCFRRYQSARRRSCSLRCRSIRQCSPPAQPSVDQAEDQLDLRTTLKMLVHPIDHQLGRREARMICHAHTALTAAHPATGCSTMPCADARGSAARAAGLVPASRRPRACRQRDSERRGSRSR